MLAQALNASLGQFGAAAALKAKRLGDHADRQGAQFARDLGDDRRTTGTGPAAHSGGHKDHVRALEQLGDLVRRLLSGTLPELGVAAAAEAASDLVADPHPDRGAGTGQRLRIGVQGDKVDPLHTDFNHAVHRVRTAAPHAYDLQLGKFALCLEAIHPQTPLRHPLGLKTLSHSIRREYQ